MYQPRLAKQEKRERSGYLVPCSSRKTSVRVLICSETTLLPTLVRPKPNLRERRSNPISRTRHSRRSSTFSHTRSIPFFPQRRFLLQFFNSVRPRRFRRNNTKRSTVLRKKNKPATITHSLSSSEEATAAAALEPNFPIIQKAPRFNFFEKPQYRFLAHHRAW